MKTYRRAASSITLRRESTHGDFGFVVQALDDVAGELLLGLEVRAGIVVGGETSAVPLGPGRSRDRGKR